MGIHFWDSTESDIYKLDMGYKDSLGPQAIIRLNLNKPSASFDPIKQQLDAAGLDTRYDIIPANRRQQIVVSELDQETKRTLVGRLKALSEGNKFYKGLGILTEIASDTVVIEGLKSDRLLQEMMEDLRAQEYTVNRSVNEQETLVLRVSWKNPDLTEAAATSQITGLLQEGGFVAGPERPGNLSENPIIRSVQNANNFRLQKPKEATGLLYLIGNTTGILSGLLRGNVGESLEGMFYMLSNIQLAFGKRKMRSEDQIIHDSLEDFPELANGKRDFEKNSGFNRGPSRFGKLIDDFLNWRDEDNNIFNIKIGASLLAGASALHGGLTGGKQLLQIDENGDVVLGEDGKPLYKQVADTPLIASGVLALTAYAPLAVYTPKNSNSPPIFNVSGLADNAVMDGIGKVTEPIRQTPVGQKVGKVAQNIKDDPAPFTGNLMGTRNLQHIGFALRDGFIRIPDTLKEYEHKFATDALRLFTEAGGKDSLKAHICGPNGLFPELTDIVDSYGTLTAQAVSLKNTVIAEYDANAARLQEIEATLEKGGRRAKRNQPALQAEAEQLRDYLKTNDSRYDAALLIGTFDLDDRAQRHGLLRRQKEPASFEKLIERHEDRLKDPYHVIETGCPAERAYVAALNRQRYQGMSDDRYFPWVRLFYSTTNFLSAMQLKSANKNIQTPDTNNVDAHLDQHLLYQRAAEAILANFDATQYQTAEQRHEALDRAISNFAKKLDDERELRSFDIYEEEIRAGISARIHDMPTPRDQHAVELAQAQQSQHTIPTITPAGA